MCTLPCRLQHRNATNKQHGMPHPQHSIESFVLQADAPLFRVPPSGASEGSCSACASATAGCRTQVATSGAIAHERANAAASENGRWVTVAHGPIPWFASSSSWTPPQICARCALVPNRASIIQIIIALPSPFVVLGALRPRQSMRRAPQEAHNNDQPHPPRQRIRPASSRDTSCAGASVCSLQPAAQSQRGCVSAAQAKRPLAIEPPCRPVERTTILARLLHASESRPSVWPST